MPVPRGTIKNFQHATQARDFNEIRWGKITPTDVDLSIDFGGKFFVFADLKFQGATMPRGQEIYFENLCRVLWKGGSHAVAIVAEHCAPPNTPIRAYEAIVTRYFLQTPKQPAKWRTPREQIYLKKAVDDLLKLYDMHEYLTITDEHLSHKDVGQFDSCAMVLK